MRGKRLLLLSLLCLIMICVPYGRAEAENKGLDAPVLSSAENRKDGVTVRWKAVSEAEMYRVFRKVPDGSWKKLKDVAGTEYTDTTAVNGKTYIYTVRCVTADGTRFAGAYDAAGLMIYRLPEPAVTLHKNAEKVNITWSRHISADGYYVYRKLPDQKGWTRIATIKDNTVGAYTDAGCRGNTKYYYTVKCYAVRNGLEYHGTYATDRSITTYLPSPALKSIENVKGGVRLSWGAVKGAPKYQVFRKVPGGGWGRIGITAGTSFTDKATFKSGQKYLYTVRCLNQTENAYLSHYNEKGIAIYRLPERRVTLKASAGGVQISWNKDASASGYYVYRKLPSDKGWKRIHTVKTPNTLSYTDAAKNLQSGTKYQYTVKSYKNADGMTYTGNWEPYNVSTMAAKMDVGTFLQKAMLPVGQTLYVWGGGWDVTDTTAGETALYLGLYPKWKTYYDNNKSGYNYRIGQNAWFNGERDWRFYGLDCTGYVGWSIYNAMNSAARRSGGYVYKSTGMADWLADLGLGSSRSISAWSEVKPGDIISMQGHVYIILGSCSDGSILLSQSTPNGGIVVTGIGTKATTLAKDFMKNRCPDWWKYFGGEGTYSADRYTYMSGTGFSWKTDLTISDRDGVRSMSGEEVLEYLKNRL